MTTVYSKSLFQSDDPDGHIPGLRMQKNPRVKLPPSMRTRNLFDLDNIEDDAPFVLPKVLSREDLMENYAHEKREGHLSSQLDSARKYVHKEYNISTYAPTGEYKDSTITNNKLAFKPLHEMDVQEFKAMQDQIAKSKSSVSGFGNNNADYVSNNNNLVFKDLHEMDVHEFKAMQDQIANTKSSVLRHENIHAARANNIITHDQNPFNIKDFLKDVDKSTFDRRSQKTEQQKPAQLKELEDLMRRMDGLNSGQKQHLSAPSNTTSIAAPSRAETPFNIKKYLEEINTRDTSKTSENAPVQPKGHQKSEREKDLEDMIRHMDQLILAQNQAAAHSVPAVPQPAARPHEFVNNYTSGSVHTEQNNSPFDSNSPVVESLKKQVNQLSARINEQEDEIAQVRSDTQQKQRESKVKADLSEVRCDLEKQFSELNDRISNAEMNKNYLSKRLDQTQQELLVVRRQSQTERKVEDPLIKELKSQINDLNSRLKGMEKEKDSLNVKLNRTQQEIEQVKMAAEQERKDQQCKNDAKVKSSMQLIMKDLDNDIVKLDAKIYDVKNDGEVLKDLIEDTQRDLANAKLVGLQTHMDLIEGLNDELVRLEEETSINIQNGIESVQNSFDDGLAKVESRRKRTVAKINELRRSNKEYLKQQRDDFAKFQQVQGQAIARIQHDVKRKNVSSKRKTKKLAVAVQKDFKTIRGENKERLYAVYNMQERIYLSLRDRLNRVAQLYHRADKKRMKKFEQLRCYIAELEQNLKTVRQEENESNSDSIMKTLNELKERSYILESERTQVLRECASMKDSTILGLVEAIKEQGSTKCEDKKVQFINTWHIGNKQPTNPAMQYPPVSTQVYMPPNAGQNILPAYYALGYQVPCVNEQPISSKRRNKRRGAQRAGKGRNVEGQSHQQADFSQSESEFSNEEHSKVVNFHEGMPEADVGDQRHTDKNQCVSDPPAANQREHLHAVDQLNEDTEPQNRASEDQNSSTDFDEDNLQPPAVSSEAELQNAADGPPVDKDVNDEALPSNEGQEEGVIDREEEQLETEEESDEPSEEDAGDASDDDSGGIGCFAKVAGVLLLPCILPCAAGVMINSRRKKNKNRKKYKNKNKKDEKSKDESAESDDEAEESADFADQQQNPAEEDNIIQVQTVASEEGIVQTVASEEGLHPMQYVDSDSDEDEITPQIILGDVINCEPRDIDHVTDEEQSDDDLDSEESSEGDDTDEESGKSGFFGRLLAKGKKSKKNKKKARKEKQKKAKKDKNNKKGDVELESEESVENEGEDSEDTKSDKKSGKMTKLEKKQAKKDAKKQKQALKKLEKQAKKEKKALEKQAKKERKALEKQAKKEAKTKDKKDKKDKKSKKDKGDEELESGESVEGEGEDNKDTKSDKKSDKKSGKMTKQEKKQAKKDAKKEKKALKKLEKQAKKEKKALEKQAKKERKAKEKQEKKEKKATEKAAKKDGKKKDKVQKDKKDKESKKGKDKEDKVKTDKKDKSDKDSKKDKEKEGNVKTDKKDKKVKDLKKDKDKEDKVKTDKKEKKDKENNKDKKDKKSKKGKKVKKGKGSFFSNLFSSCFGRKKSKRGFDSDNDSDDESDDESDVEDSSDDETEQTTSEEVVDSNATVINVKPKAEKPSQPTEVSTKEEQSVNPTAQEVEASAAAKLVVQPPNTVVSEHAKPTTPAVKNTFVPPAKQAKKLTPKVVTPPAVALLATKADNEVVKPAAKPEKKVVTEPVKPAVKPVAEAAVTAQSVAKPVAVPETKPVAKPTTKPATAPASGSAAESSAEQATKSNVKPADVPTKPAAKPRRRSTEDEQLDRILEELREPAVVTMKRLRDARKARPKSEEDKLLDEVLAELRRPPSPSDLRRQRTASEIELDNLIGDLRESMDTPMASSRRTQRKTPMPITLPQKTIQILRSGKSRTSGYSLEEEELMNQCLSSPLEKASAQHQSMAYTAEQSRLMEEISAAGQTTYSAAEQELMDSCWDD